MAIQGPTYNQSAVDILSPMLTITQNMRQNRASKGDKLYKGAGDLASGLAGWQAMEKRKATFVEYVGDEALAGMEQKLEELKAELSSVESAMKTIRAEDADSMDLSLSPDRTDSASGTPQDVDQFPVTGRRTGGTFFDTNDPDNTKFNYNFGTTNYPFMNKEIL